MKRSRSHTTTCWHAYHHISVLSPPVVDLGQVVYNLVKAYCYKVGKLHFHHTLEPLQRKTQSSTYDSALAQRRIPYPLLPKLLHKAFCYFKGTSILRNILSHQNEVLVLLHRLIKPFLDGVY